MGPKIKINNSIHKARVSDDSYFQVQRESLPVDPNKELTVHSGEKQPPSSLLVKVKWISQSWLMLNVLQCRLMVDKTSPCDMGTVA